jgi:hypothetical protein
MMDDEPSVDKQIKTVRAANAGVPPEKIAAYLDLTLAQVEATIALDRRFRREEEEFLAWMDANKEPS